jgi:excisionase family DNA binding protein
VNSSRRIHCNAKTSIVEEVEPTAGLEPATCGLRMRHTENIEQFEESRRFTSRRLTPAGISPSVSTRPDNHDQFAALVLRGSERLYSPKEAAGRLGIKRSTVYTLCAKGELPCVRIGSLWRIDVDGFLAGRYASRR